jgi:uncharacterized protein (TIGR02270 family)
MNAVMDAPGKSNNAYQHIYEQFLIDGAFLWLLRSIAVNQPHYRQQDLLELEQRIDAQLNGLMTAPEQAWSICEEALVSTEEPGEAFAAAVLAFRSLDIQKIQRAIEISLSAERAFPGLASAIGWLPGRICHSWIKKFLTSKDLNHKYLAITVCSLRREDPREYLNKILQREDCLAHPKLYARAIRLVGELKRRDLIPALHIAIASDDPEVSFWANWSAAILGDRARLHNLKQIVLNEGVFQKKAIDLAFRGLPIEEARQWIGLLAKNTKNAREVIYATAVLGDPQAVPWLINQMRIPELTRVSGEAFTTITGIELEANGLSLDELPDLDNQFSDDETSKSDVDLDMDEHLPFPDVNKVAAVWQKYQQHFISGKRYFLGKLVETEHLKHQFSQGTQRHRRAAALELALLQPDHFLPNYRAKVIID